MDTETRLERLESLERIRSLKARYCDLCDEGYDANALTELFTEDGVWDGGELGRYRGREQIHRFFSTMPKVMSFAIHHVTNPTIELSEDGRRACARWYLLQTATLREGNQAVWLAGRYDDVLVQRDRSWKFETVKIRTRLFTPYEDGWGKVPMLSI